MATTSEDPQIIISSHWPEDQRFFEFTFSVNAEKPTLFEIFYKNQHDLIFSQDKSIGIELFSGANYFNLTLFSLIPIKEFRIDPVNYIGVVKITSQIFFSSDKQNEHNF